MSDFKTIWGIKVPVSPTGRINWPNELKRLAVKKILDEGMRNAVVAQELGAHDNLVRKWCIQERRLRGEDVSSQPVFAPVTFSEQATRMPAQTKAVLGVCKLSLGEAVLEFPADIPPENLQAMIRAMREVL